MSPLTTTSPKREAEVVLRDHLLLGLGEVEICLETNMKLNLKDQ